MKLVNVIVKDSSVKPHQTTSLRLEMRTGIKSVLADSLKYSFPDFEPTKLHVVFTIRSTQPVKLRKSIDSFISTVMLTLEEKMDEASYKLLIEQVRIRVGQLNDKVIILEELGSSMMTKSFEENFNKLLLQFRDAELNLSARLQTNGDLFQVLNLVNSNLYNLESEELQSRNLLKLITEGLYMSLSIGCHRRYKEALLETYKTKL